MNIVDVFPVLFDGLIGRKARPVSVLGHKVDLALKLFGTPKIVGVEVGDIAAMCLAESLIARPGYALVDFLLEKPKTKLTRAERPDNSSTTIGRAIVHNDNLQVVHSLSRHARNSLSNVNLAVVAGNDD